ncbi:hypothetical protein [Streptomyces canus]|uniref:hypothetical protein n=1 Tax=Streptomyces canus TaxID=58343 RepID=UPI003712DBB7
MAGRADRGRGRLAPEKLRLRQALAWLVIAEPGLGVLFPDGAGPVTWAPGTVPGSPVGAFA